MVKKILIVDDEPDILRLAAFGLTSLGYEVITAGDGQEALNLIRSEKPDLVLLDLQLPVVSGAEVCSQVKSSEELKHIIVVLFAADGNGILAEKVNELGADDYITKPFDPEKLLEKLENHSIKAV